MKPIDIVAAPKCQHCQCKMGMASLGSYVFCDFVGLSYSTHLVVMEGNEFCSPDDWLKCPLNNSKSI
jgi:hypothetical protein